MLNDFAIYLDLDGVLADYGHGMVEQGFKIDPSLKADLNRSGTSHPLKRQMYEAVKGTDFYRRLPLMPGAVELYLACYDADPIILTAAPKFGADEDSYYVNPYWLGAAYHKRHWVEHVLLDAVERERAVRNDDVSAIAKSQRGPRKPIPDERFVCTTSARKWQYMHRKHSDHQILIDDRIANVEAWAAAGGVGILHLNAETSIRALDDYKTHAVNMLPGWGCDGKGWLFDPRIVP